MGIIYFLLSSGFIQTVSLFSIVTNLISMSDYFVYFIIFPIIFSSS